MMLQPLRNNSARSQVVRSGVVQAPTGGWDASSPLAAMPKDRAVELVNWFPQPGYIEVRRGHDYHAWDLDSDTTPVKTLMVWQGMASSKLFAAAGAVIYDVTNEGQGTSSLTGMGDSAYQWVNFVNSGATYLYIVNGTNTARHYNGSTWAEPSISGLTSSDAVHINVHKNRIWFVEKDSLSAWYLATSAIAGAATEFPLGGLFSKGGYLVAMATWTRDGGSGSDDFAVFITSRGQVALYQGTDPSSASTWALVGVFDVPAPIGRRCFTKYGADLMLITIEGVFPLSQLLSVDQGTARAVAVTQNIQNEFVETARSNKDLFGWEVCVYPRGTSIIVNVPTVEFNDADQYVQNSLTGAWCRFHGQNANCWVVYNDLLYFGGNDGSVYLADYGSADVSTPITAICQTAYQPFQTPGTLKRFTAMQPLVTSSQGARPSLGISVDFQETSELSTGSATTTTGVSLWDQAEWDVDEWAGSIQQSNDWVSIPALGRFASVKVQAQTGTQTTGVEGSYWGISLWGEGLWGGENFNSDEVMRLNGFVVLYETGAFI